jgi:hypothetical protein
LRVFWSQKPVSTFAEYAHADQGISADVPGSLKSAAPLERHDIKARRLNPGGLFRGWQFLLKASRSLDAGGFREGSCSLAFDLLHPQN